MRLTLIDLLLLLGFLLGGPVLGDLLCRWTAHPELRPLGVGAGFVAGLASASFFYRRFHFRPLLLPRCPHCRRRPELYGVAEGGWPREVVVCGSCRGVCHLWYVRNGPAEEVSAEVPSLTPRWPYFIGLWRTVSEGRAR